MTVTDMESGQRIGETGKSEAKRVTVSTLRFSGLVWDWE